MTLRAFRFKKEKEKKKHFNVSVSSADHSIQCLRCSGEQHLSCGCSDQSENTENRIAFGVSERT